MKPYELQDWLELMFLLFACLGPLTSLLNTLLILQYLSKLLCLWVLLFLFGVLLFFGVFFFIKVCLSLEDLWVLLLQRTYLIAPTTSFSDLINVHFQMQGLKKWQSCLFFTK